VCLIDRARAASRRAIVEAPAADASMSLRLVIASALACAAAGAGALDARAEVEPVAARPGLRGRVVDGRGRPIAGATVSGGGASAVSASDGSFALDALDAADARLDLFAYAAGYLPRTVAVAADDAATTIELAAEMTPTAGDEVIEISGEAPEEARPIGYQLTVDQVRALPAAGNDLLRAVQSLPGVSRLSYGLGGLVLRGADAADTRTYLDGIEVPLAFHFGGLTSFYPSTLLDSLTVTPSGGDVAYGRAIGGVVDIRSRAGRRDRWRSGGELSLLDASVHADGPAAGGTLIAGLRRSYVGDIVGAVAPSDYRFLPRYFDGQLRWDRRLGAGTLTAQLFFADDLMTRADTIDVQQRFVRAGLRYRQLVGAAHWTTLLWAGARTFYVHYADELGIADDEDSNLLHMEQSMLPFGLRSDLRRDTDWGHLAVGFDFESTRYGEAVNQDFDDDVPDVSSPHWTRQLGAWAEARWRIADGALVLKPGLRVDYFSAAATTQLEPRIVVAHDLHPRVTLRESLSLHHQPPSPLNIVDDDGERVRVAPARAVHASVGAELRLPREVAATVSLYQNQSEGPRVASDAQFAAIRSLGGLGVVAENLVGNELGNDGGRARARGLELSVHRQTERWLLWAAYTLARSEHHTGVNDRAQWHVSTIDQTHNLNLIASTVRGKWRLGARLRATSGFPLFLYQMDPTDIGDDSDADAIPRVMARRLRAFVSVDLRVDRAWQRPWGTIAAFLDLQNATNRANEEGSMQTDDGGREVLTGLPIFPIFGVSFTPPAPR
jgi:hypothetical protein